MRIYKEKMCLMCDITYTPTSPKQKVCLNCKSKSTKLSQAIRDAKNNRLKHNVIFTKTCPICEITFTTYDNKKIYCGSIPCENVRKRKNRLAIDKRRTILRSKQHKLQKYRKQGILLKYIKTFIKDNNYTLISARKYTSTHHSPLEILCNSGHMYTTTFHGFKDNNTRCPICYQQNNYVSKPEQLVRDFILENFPDLLVEYNNRSVIAPKELDLYFPDKNLAIEVCGLYWHGELSSNKSRDYHYNKMMLCYEKGIRLITIFEDDLYNYKDIVFSRIRQALGSPLRRIYARKCQVREIDSKTTNIFYSTNHVQGKSNALIRYGLYYNDELVCVGSLGKLGRKHTSDEFTLELKRFCTLPNVSVIGGIGKIFKQMRIYAIENGIKEIRSYCDMRYANIFNPVYEVIGFSLLTFTKYTPHYFKGQKRYRNIGLRKTPEERLTGLTEWELRKEQGYDRIWDCGHRTYIYKVY
ncbi:hypothetical protein JZU46_00150 [bacterium]|nr:hypothetical protein [bacterium]